MADKSRLHFSISQKQWPIVYHPSYNIGFMGLQSFVPLDTERSGRVLIRLVVHNMLQEKDTVQPREPTEADLRVVHTERYLESLRNSAGVARIFEVPRSIADHAPFFLINRFLLKPLRLQTGGSILAGKLALERGWSINLGGGFHHCSTSKGGGFCVYADISLALRFLLNKNLISKAAIIDLDAHQCNGPEKDFLTERRVVIFDAYNSKVYPKDKFAARGMSKAVTFGCGVKTKEYLSAIKKELPGFIQRSKPDFILYNAGTACLAGDPLGQMNVTAEGIKERDAFVFELAKSQDIPIMMVLGGGFQDINSEVIANSILNLWRRGLISAPGPKHKFAEPLLRRLAGFFSSDKVVDDGF